MKTLFTLVSMLLFLSAGSPSEKGKWVIDYNSQLSIHGQTNVNSFTCFISCYNSVDTLSYEQVKQNGQLIFEGNKMIIPVFNFNCGNNLITKDFRTTLKADKNPYLTLSFISLEKNPSCSKATANLVIALAGVEKKAAVKFDLVNKGGFLQLTGRHAVCFADFELQAPQRMLGLVKVQDDLNVDFNLLIRPL